MPKYLYCSRCKNHPDKIREVLNFSVVTREWNEQDENYEATDMEDGELDKIECGVCGTKLENYEETPKTEGTHDVNPSPISS